MSRPIGTRELTSLLDSRNIIPETKHPTTGIHLNRKSTRPQRRNATVRRLTSSGPQLHPLYSPLRRHSSIRILKVLPGSPNDQLICSLHVIRDIDQRRSVTSNRTAYEALSYVWGSLEDRSTIKCNGQVVQVTRNLADALHRLRWVDKARLIWADAICIDQGNLAERGHQVRLMGQIYQKAERVLIWAGKDEGCDAGSAFALLKEIANGTVVANSTDQGHLVSRSAWESLKTFYRIPWLRRLWVLQEVALSSSAIVLWGDTELSWDIVGHASEVIQDNQNLWSIVDQRTGVGNAYLMHRLRSSNPPLHSFRTLLQRARRFETTDPRDRIFAVLGLSTTDKPTGDVKLFLEPDYTLTVPQLYLAVAQRIMESDQNLGLLSAVQHRHEDLSLRKEMPTWVPRWNNFSVNILAGVDGKSHKVAFGLSAPEPVYSIKEPDCLIVQGLEIDVIARTTDKMAEEDFRLSNVPSKSNSNSHFWRRRFDELLNQPIESHLKALPWTMTAGKDWADEPISNPASHWLDFKLWWTSISLQDDMTDRGGQCSHSDKGGIIKRFLVAASDCWGRRLFVTETGFVGLGPEALQVGDKVCVLTKGPVPYVLREGHEHYLFVGESYVYGIMEGEAVQSWQEGRLSLQKFELR